jgi:hypothetical protein
VISLSLSLSLIRCIAAAAAAAGAGPESEKEESSKMRTAIETMTDCVATITNYKKDGTKFINQSSLFVIFQTASDCPHTKMATAQLLCVHADVTGLGPEVCKQVEDDATVLKGVVQQALQDGTLDVNKDGGVGLSGKHARRMRSHAHNHTQREIGSGGLSSVVVTF